MEILTDIPLKNLTTMRLGGPARFMAEVRTIAELKALYQNATSKSLSVLILGGGSNVIAKDEGFNGLIIRMRIPGFEVVSDDLHSTSVKIGAGENWDEVVAKTVAMRLSGIEAMSAIPGTTGAAPVQNIGAYGQEIADTLVSLEAYDTTTNTVVILSNADCHFSYRSSIFRSTDKGRYIITSITLKLSKNAPQPPFYEALQGYLDSHNLKIYTVDTIRQAVIDIRSAKLPDPLLKPNAGSFFKNAIIEEWKLNDLRRDYPSIPSYAMGDGSFKIPTGWLIEQAGFKGELLNGIRVHDANALVLINETGGNYENLRLARDEIISRVRDTFRIEIEQEPLEI